MRTLSDLAYRAGRFQLPEHVARAIARGDVRSLTLYVRHAETEGN
jgi:hypothetical protein